ncbi:MAG TPA: hypothetical protein ENI20_15595 [Bacteroides sp.]|nr:hypothetical protein [Bacteroides sp.]
MQEDIDKYREKFLMGWNELTKSQQEFQALENPEKLDDLVQLWVDQRVSIIKQITCDTSVKH